MLHDSYSINSAGHFCLGGVDTVELAQKYGTPLYILDEDNIRRCCRTYVDAMKKHFGPGSAPLYASKANSFKRIYKIVAEEGMCTDVVSAGELYTALSAGFPADRIYFHGSAKTDEDIRMGVDNGVGCFIVDNLEELQRLDAYAGKKGVKQKILLRITPGIDPHTYEAVNTGKVDSKFGSPLETGQAMELIGIALGFKNLELQGFHCHIGSQVFDTVPFTDTADIMIEFIAQVRDTHGFTAKVFDMGGGFGVRYTEEDPELDIGENISAIAGHLKEQCAKHNIPMPAILFEPGRSIVAAAGVTLYTVESVKKIKGYKNYAAIDGGMTDNPRYALYQSQYTVCLANRADEKADFRCDVVGRCCESGDIIKPDALLPEPKLGDKVAVMVTGAYNYSMSSNYNSVPRPPIVMVKDGADYLAVRRETYEDMTACHL